MADKVKKKKDPISSFSILLILLVVLAVISWIAAAATGGTVTGASLSNILTAPIYGFTGAPTDVVEGAVNPATFPGGALEVCFFVMILGGFLGVMTKTGALDNGIAALVKKLHGNELVLIPILMILFSIGGTTYGMCEETVPFYVLLAATMYAAGFDAMVGSAVVLLGAGCGVSAPRSIRSRSVLRFRLWSMRASRSTRARSSCSAPFSGSPPSPCPSSTS